MRTPGLIERIIGNWRRLQQESDWAQWHGAYYEFDGRQIRILLKDGAIWVVADDVFDALGLHGRQRDAARVREIAGRDGLMQPPGTRMLAFSEIGMRAWLDRRSDRVAHKFSQWLDKQVIAPYRRRRELEGKAEAAS